MTNSEKYPEAWKVFVKCARNNNGQYNIPNPLNTCGFIWADDPLSLFNKFKAAFYEAHPTKEQIFKKIRHIAHNLNG